MRKTAAIILLLAMAAVAALPAAARAEDDVFLLGLIPEENIFRAIQKHRPLEAYLGEKLGVKVKFTVLSRYGDIVDRYISRDMDGAFFGIYTSALAMEKLGVEPIVRSLNNDGSSTARGYLFARKDSGIRNIEDMKYKRAAFVDKATATGYIFAVAYLMENGIEDIDEFFSEYFFTGSHESTIYSVLDGRADVGAAKGRVLDRLIEKDPLIKDEIYIISRSINLPDNTLMIGGDIRPAAREKLRNALLTMDRTPRGAEILETLGIRKFVVASPEDFEVVKELAAKAGIKTAE
ncbi:MAG: phosphate/phosphite/phosphonate ABC transporter substrate-binding protein [Nitrospirota bacterium]|jgi:phosphonate transport system substrate-binding protein